jgi:hypothetical protein
MLNRVKKIVVAFFALVLSVGIVGLPIFYHNCNTQGFRNLATVFTDTETHCKCCNNLDNCKGKSAIDNEIQGGCCVASHSENTESKSSVTHSNCCIIQLLSLKMNATKPFQHQFKSVISFVNLYHSTVLVQQTIQPEIHISIFNGYLIAHYLAGEFLFLFEQFLL